MQRPSDILNAFDSENHKFGLGDMPCQYSRLKFVPMMT
jgi:hypothetical protein